MLYESGQGDCNQWVGGSLLRFVLYLRFIKRSTAPAVPGRTPRSREDLDADLQRAIELSLADSQPSSARYVGSEPPLARKTGTVEDDDEEMRLAIEASLRDIEKARPSAPQNADEPELKVSVGSYVQAC